MKRIILLFIVVNLTILVSAQVEKYSRIKISVQQTDLQKLAQNGITLDAGYYDVKLNYYIAELSQREIVKLQTLGFPIEVLVDDLAKWYVSRNDLSDVDAITEMARRAPSDYPVPVDFELGSCGGFCTIDECYAHLDYMAMMYPDLITVRAPASELTTANDSSLYYVKISDNPNQNEGEPQVLYTGMHHAREAIGMQHLLFFMYYLLENYATDDEIRQLVDNTEMYFIPIVNVDGYSRNIQTNPAGGGMWRKNRRPNGDGSYGVDINRNYGYGWGYDDEGSSPVTYDETYRGIAGFSEIETTIIKEFCESHNFKIALNYHSYSGLLLYAWGYIPETTPDENVFSAYAKAMNVDNHYTYGPGCTTIYPSNGGSDDWMYGEQSTKDKILAYTPECGNGNDGFWPFTSRIIPLCQENMIQSILAARYSGTFGKLMDQTPLIIPSTNYYATFDLTRMGQTPANYTVSIEPLDGVFASVGEPVQISGLPVLGKVTDSIPFTLNTGIKSGDTLRFVMVLNDGFITYRDTVEKYFGTPVVLLSDDLSTSENWTGQWSLTNLFPYSAPSCMTDSPIGNYGNNANKSTQLTNTISLTNASVAVLNFYARWNLETGYDYVQLFITTNNGQTWIPLEGRYTKQGSAYQAMGEPVYDDQSYWVKEEINISEYAGQNIKLRFTLQSDDATTRDGFYFDDLLVTMIDKTVDVKNIEPNTNTGYLSEAFPNPATDYVKFKYDLNTGISQNSGLLQDPESLRGYLLLTDLQGRIISKTVLNSNEKEVRINLSGLSSGMYVCTLVEVNRPSISRKMTIR